MSTVRVGACLLLLVGSGVAHGVFTHRWQAAADFGETQARLNTVPPALGPWVARDVPLSADELDRISVRAHLSREYRNTQTGRAVRMLVVAGPPGPISVHTPDVCFQGTGFEQSTTPEQVAVGDGAGQLWAATFSKTGPVRTQIRVYWAWNGGSGWEAPEHRRARYKFAFQPILYKIYLVTEADRQGATNPRPAEDLAARLLPDISRALAGQP